MFMKCKTKLFFKKKPCFVCFLQLLLGCGGSPLFTLGTTYIDNHVKRDSSSMYIGGKKNT